MKLSAIRNHIIFEFLDKLDSQGQFTQTSDAGLHIVGHFESSAQQPRWARVLTVGPQTDEVLADAGCEVLIDNLKWTEGVVLEGKKVWRTDDKHVLAYRYPA
jgi:hypothetical protein